MSDSKEVFKNISHYYDELVSRYGHNPKACDYGTDQSQKIKFSVIADGCDFTNSSVLDVGCGFADFSVHLKKHYENVDYTGIDISAAMIDNARSLHPDINLQLGNFFEMHWPDDAYDYVTANGIFYLLRSDAFSFMRSFVEKAFKVARKGVIFNTLSIKSTDKEPNEFYADPADVLKLCFEMSPWVTLRHDYHHRDFTCFLFKEKK